MKLNLTIWLIAAIGMSASLNIFLLWYIRKIIIKFLFISENLSDLVTVIVNYQKHLKQVYKLDMFYGDETLKFLMSHTNSLLDILKEYEDVYSIAVPIEIAKGDQELDNENYPEEDTPEEDVRQTSEENVFYAGPRTSNN